MALRILTCIFICLSASAVNLGKALESYRAGNFQKTIELIKQANRSKSSVSQYSIESLILISKAFEKMGDFTSAIKFQNYIIEKQYSKEHESVLKAVNEEVEYEDLNELPEPLLKIYYSLLGTYISIYKTNSADELRKLILRYGNLLIDQDYKAERVKRILKKYQNEKFSDTEEDDDDEEEPVEVVPYQLRFFVMSSYISWQDNLTLVSNDRTTSIVINSTTEGTMLSVGINYANNKYEFKSSIGYALATATVGEIDPDFRYLQDNVSETLLMFNNSFLIKTGETVSIGLSAPIVLRSGNFTEPDGFEFEETSIISYGVFGQLSWKLKKFFMDVEVGKVLDFKSTFFKMSLGYMF